MNQVGTVVRGKVAVGGRCPSAGEASSNCVPAYAPPRVQSPPQHHEQIPKLQGTLVSNWKTSRRNRVSRVSSEKDRMPRSLDARGY